MFYFLINKQNNYFKQANILIAQICYHITYFHTNIHTNLTFPQITIPILNYFQTNKYNILIKCIYMCTNNNSNFTFSTNKPTYWLFSNIHTIIKHIYKYKSTITYKLLHFTSLLSSILQPLQPFNYPYTTKS